MSRSNGRKKSSPETCNVCHTAIAPELVPEPEAYSNLYAQHVIAQLKRALHYADMSWGVSDMQWIQNQIDAVNARTKHDINIVGWLQGLEMAAVSYFEEPEVRS
jgi:hypothetical protein